LFPIKTKVVITIKKVIIPAIRAAVIPVKNGMYGTIYGKATIAQNKA
jgi:hypothetical protein